MDEDIPLKQGPFFDLRNSLHTQLEEGRSPMLTTPDMDAALASVMHIQPLVTWHATKVYSAALYLDPASYCSGWIDNVFKSLLRDGFWFVQVSILRPLWSVSGEEFQLGARCRCN
jgi:hypothetical protein